MATSDSPVNLSSSLVSWQTAYWTLVPLVVSTMSQPSGRVLSVPSKYRTYLRCSPVICAADTLSILVHLICYLTSFPPKDAIELLISERFGGDEESEEGIQAVKKVTFVRWLFFVFGTLGPAVKLMAMEGIPGTKAWGAMLLASFLVVEVLVILSWIYGSHEALPGAQESRRHLRIKERLKHIDEVLLAFSALFYVIVLLWMAVDIYYGFGLLDNARFASFSRFKIYAGITGIYLSILPSIIMMVFCVPYPTDYFFKRIFRIDFESNTNWTIGLVAFLAPRICVLVVLGIYGCRFPYTKKLLLSSLYSWMWVIFLVLPGLTNLRFLERYAESWPRFSRSVFITWESKKEKKANWISMYSGEEDSTCLNFVMLVYTTILTVIWYWHRYNPEGTVNRGWTGVFG